MQTVLQDLRYSLRTLANSPVFTAVALLSLGLGIGANAAIFTLMDQVLLRFLPVKDPAQLVMLNYSGPNQGRMMGPNMFSYPMYRDLRDGNSVFSGLLASFPVDLSLTFGHQTDRVHGELVSGNYFDVLGVQAATGRTLTADDDRVPGGHSLVVLTDAYWRRRFGADRGILNKTIVVNGHPMLVVGIVRPGFHGIRVGSETDLMIPLMMKAQFTPGWDDLENRRSMWLELMGRLKPGVSANQAEAALNTLWRPILEMELKDIPNHSPRFQKGFLGRRLVAAPGAKGRSNLRRQFSAPLIVLMSMVGLVLLIACANVANLLVARAAARRKEIAVRLALGAGRPRIVQQMLVESLLLAFGGGALGLLLAAWTARLLIEFLPFEGALQTLSTTPDLRVILFTLGLTLLTGLLFGMIPALQSTRPKIAETLKDQGNTLSGGTGQVRLRKLLVVTQIALSLLLLVGAGLFAKSLYNLKTLYPGFHADHLMTFTVDPSLNDYMQPQVRAFYERLQDNIAGLPGVNSVSAAEVSLMSDDMAIMTVTVEGYKRQEGEDTNPHINGVAPGFFSTLGVPLVAGRDFTRRDSAGAPKVAIINEKMARYFFHNDNPLGRRFGFGGPPKGKIDIEIVGVVKDIKSHTLREEIPRFVYFPYPQDENAGAMTFYVRTSQTPSALAGQLRAEVQKLDPNLPVYGMKTMATQVDESLFVDRLIALLSCFFGLLATLLAAVGLYGVMAYSVARRTREIGVRVALGATRANVLQLVMREVAILAVTGILVALPASLAISRYVRSQLFGIAPNDPWILAGATLTLAVVALLAGYLPAMRATRVDPLIALRYE